MIGSGCESGYVQTGKRTNKRLVTSWGVFQRRLTSIPFDADHCGSVCGGLCSHFVLALSCRAMAMWRIVLLAALVAADDVELALAAGLKLMV